MSELCGKYAGLSVIDAILLGVIKIRFSKLMLSGRLGNK
jgi:hypothetical protein